MKTCNRLFRVVSVLLLTFILSGPLAAQDEDYFPAAEWRTSTPEEQGIDSAKLLEALQYIEAEGLAIDSLTVIRHGYVVLDAYYYPYTAEVKHHLDFATMSFTATLLGIALDKGWIDSLDRPFLDWLPDVTLPAEGNVATKATVGNLLEWTSGFYCADGNLDPQAATAPNATRDRVERILAQGQMNREPGGIFDGACGYNSDILMGVLENASDEPLSEFADEEFFAPLGIRDYRWTADQNDLYYGCQGLWLTPHDVARLGYLYLKGGEWMGDQIVPETWIDFVTCADPDLCKFEQRTGLAAGPSSDIGFGRHWFMRGTNSYMAFDYWGEMLVVTPEMDTVVVITSAGDDFETVQRKVAIELFTNRLLGAVTSDEPLPANITAQDALVAAVDRLAHPTPTEPSPLPEIASQISGHVYDFKRSLHASWSPMSNDRITGRPLDINAFALTFGETDEALLDLYYADGTQVSVPVGLDGVWRTTETEYGLLAARGAWYTGPVSFRFELREVGNDNRQLYNIRFDGQRAFVGWVHSASLALDQLQATVREQ